MHKKWNISLLVIFVLVACSLLGIIAVQYTRHMATQTNQIYNHYKAYYLAKGGIEIGLSLMKLHGVWYELHLPQGNPFIQKNISSGSAFSLTIQGVSNIISQGHPENKTCTTPLTINKGESYILPLFIDNPPTELFNHFSPNHFYKNKSDLLSSLVITGLQNTNTINIGLIISSWGAISELGMYFSSEIFQGDSFFEVFSDKVQQKFNTTNDTILMNRKEEPSLQNYLIIANKESQEIQFCLKLPQNEKLPLPKVVISSFWYAGTKKIGLESIYQQPIPSYLIDSSIEE